MSRAREEKAIYRGYDIESSPATDGWWSISLDNSRPLNVQVSLEAAQGWVDGEKRRLANPAYHSVKDES